MCPEELDFGNLLEFVKKVVQYHGPMATVYRDVVCILFSRQNLTTAHTELASRQVFLSHVQILEK